MLTVGQLVAAPPGEVGDAPLIEPVRGQRAQPVPLGGQLRLVAEPEPRRDPRPGCHVAQRADPTPRKPARSCRHAAGTEVPRGRDEADGGTQEGGLAGPVRGVQVRRRTRLQPHVPHRQVPRPPHPVPAALQDEGVGAHRSQLRRTGADRIEPRRRPHQVERIIGERAAALERTCGRSVDRVLPKVAGREHDRQHSWGLQIRDRPVACIGHERRDVEPTVARVPHHPAHLLPHQRGDGHLGAPSRRDRCLRT